MVGPLQAPKKKPFELPPEMRWGAQETPSTPTPKKLPEKSIGGFTENLLNDAWETLKGLYEIIPSSYKSYKENVPYILQNLDTLTPGMVGGAAKETGKLLGKAIIEPYKKHGADVLYQRPLTVSADLITILTLGGGSIKNAGKIARAAGGGEKATKLIEAGRWLEELPGKMARKGVDATVKTATGGKLDLAKRREFLALKGEEQGRRIVGIEEDLAKVGMKLDALTPDEKALFHKARALGDAPGVGVPDAALTPKVKEALAAFGEWVNRVDPAMVKPGASQFYKTRGLLTEEAATKSIAKKFALEAFDNVSDASIAKAQALINQSTRKPIYGQNVFVDELGKTRSMDTLLDDMITGGKKMREGKIDSLEHLKGAKGYTKDPSVYFREMVKNFRETEAKARLSERLLQEKALISGGGGALDPQAFREAIPEGIHRKYYEDRIRAEALKSITDPTVKRLLKWEYIKNNSGLIRLYDRVHGLFARSATKWNPKWVTGNVVGDAVLGLLAGSDWLEGVRHLKRGQMPAQIMARNVTLGTEDILNQPNAFWRVAGYIPEKAADLAGWVDQATRAGIITREVGRKLKEIGTSFEGSAMQLADVLKSTDRFSDVQVGMQLLTERVERQSAAVIKRTELTNRLEAKAARLHAELEQMDLRRRVATGGTLERRETKAAAAQAKATPPSKEPHDWMSQPGRQPTEGQLAKRGEAAKTAQAAADAARQKHVLGATGQHGFERKMGDLQIVRQRIINLTTETKAVIRDITDDLAKRGDLDALVPGLRQQVDIVRPAVERANAFVGDYLALDGFEQGVVRRIIPFYPWVRAMSMLAFRIPFLAPIKTFAWNRFSDALATITHDPDLPEDFKGKVPTFILKDGRTIWGKLTAYSPFEGLRTSRVGDVPVPAMFNVVERNPWLALGFRTFGGKTIYDVSGVPYGEPVVSLGDGTVVRVKPDGKIEREITPSPIVSSIMHTFPSVQLIQSILTPYWTNKYNWAGFPEPILKADGTYRYPRELWDRLGAAVGLNLQTRSREDIIRSRKLKALKNVNEMRGQLKRTTDPEEREFIINAMRDYIKQEIHGGRE